MTTFTDDQIIGELTTWATKRGRVADPTVLAAVLAARPAGRRCDPSVWRPGEVQAALAGAVAADPCLFLTDADVLSETLDSFFRFLRNTGRLHSSSADVAVLRKEAARAVRDLVQAFGDVRRLSACPEPGDDRWDEDRWGEEDPDDWLDPDDPRHLTRELLRDLGVDGPLAVPLPPLETAAAQGLGSRHMARVVELAELARRIGARPDPLYPSPEATKRLAGELGLDGEALTELWLDAWTIDLVSPPPESATAMGGSGWLAGLPPWRQLLTSSGLVHCRIDQLLEEGTGSGVVALLVDSLIDGPAWVPLTEAVETGRCRDHWSDGDQGAARALAELEHGVALLAEAGVLESEGQRVRLTGFGRWVVVDWIERQFS